MIRGRSRAVAKQTLAADHRSHPQPTPTQNRQQPNPPPFFRFLSKFRQFAVGSHGKPFPVMPASRNRGAPAADRGQRCSWELESDCRGIGIGISLVVSGRSKLVLFGPEVRVRTNDPGCPDSSASAELLEDPTHVDSPAVTHIFGNRRFVESYFVSRTGTTDTKTGRQKSNRGESFLSSCYTCKRIIQPNTDIYIYRGEKAFCSWDCRHREILIDTTGNLQDEEVVV